MSDTDNQRLSALLARIVDVEARISKLEAKRDDPITRVKAALLKKSIYSGKFVTVQSGYYDLTLDQRAELLKCTVPQLCKSIIFENTMHDPTVVDSHNNSKYYCVITQYTAKINVNSLRTLVHELRKPEDRLSKKKFHFQLADDQASFELSGFGHNAISPIGLKQDIPIIICNRILGLNPAIIFLGGGEVDVKLALPVADLVRGTKAIVGDITEER
eukprot:GDKK01068504.1.p1 GENE.GDKK01068504.1~~GDKK01068504.1.p1  ORF type:complete len:238 (-),score=40.21 GDKK01068504.1:127-774(-)